MEMKSSEEGPPWRGYTTCRGGCRCSTQVHGGR